MERMLAQMDSAALRGRIAELLEPHCARHPHLALTVGVVVGPAVQQVVAAGAAAPEDVEAGARLYEIGSITKVFTSLLLARLVERGLVDLDDPVQRYLPPGATAPSFGGQPITLAQLSTHTSGLPRLPKNMRVGWRQRGNPYAAYTVEQLHDFLRDHRLKRPVPAPFAYSNLGVGLLGHVLAHVLGCSYEEAVRHEICAPLGLRDTTIALSEEQRGRLVPGHRASGRHAQNWDLPTLAGAGALRSTAHDMLAFLAANLGLRETSLAASMELCHQPRARMRGPVQIGLGWVVSPLGDLRAHWHNGGTGGYTSFVGFVKERQVGVCVLANQTFSLWNVLGLKKLPVDEVGWRVLSLLCAA